MEKENGALRVEIDIVVTYLSVYQISSNPTVFSHCHIDDHPSVAVFLLR